MIVIETALVAVILFVLACGLYLIGAAIQDYLWSRE